MSLIRSRTPSPRADRQDEKATAQVYAKKASAEAYVKQVMKFDGRASSVEAPQPSVNLGGGAGLTVAAWVKRSSSQGAYDRLIDFGNGQEKENIVVNFQQQLMYEVRDGGEHHVLAVGGDAKDAAVFPIDRWTHVAIVHCADGTASIFWDGSLKASGQFPLPPPVHRENYYVGRSHWSQDPLFEGEISDVHVFDYPLSVVEVDRCCFSRALPSEARGKPILSLAFEWQGVRNAPFIDWRRRTPPANQRCGRPDCGGVGRCSGGSGATGRGKDGEGLIYLPDIMLGTEQSEHVLWQLSNAFNRQREVQGNLRKLHGEAEGRGAVREAQRITQSMDLSQDALRRAQAVDRMIRHAKRMPVHERHETGLRRQPPRLAAAMDSTSGLYHAFAIYELRSADVDDSAEAQAEGEGDEAASSKQRDSRRWHVYISEIFNMRHLIPGQTCWRATIGSLLINLLHKKARADHQVIVLKALSDAKRLEGYYTRIGFSSRQKDFSAAGLGNTYRNGEYLFT